MCVCVYENSKYEKKEQGNYDDDTYDDISKYLLMLMCHIGQNQSGLSNLSTADILGQIILSGVGGVLFIVRYC